MSTRPRFPSGVVSGVMMSVRTPAMVVPSTLTGNKRRASADWLTRHSSVRLRRSARDSGPGVVCESETSHFCASGLTVEGKGTTRVMCAVPSGSKVAESCDATSPGLLQPSGNVQIKSERNATFILAMKRFPLSKIPPIADSDQEDTETHRKSHSIECAGTSKASDFSLREAGKESVWAGANVENAATTSRAMRRGRSRGVRQ